MTRVNPHTIVIIDDDPVDAEVLVRVLEPERHHFTLRIATRGNEGVAMVREELQRGRRVLAVIDMNLPDLTGDGVLRALHPEQQTGRYIPLVWSTSNAPKDLLAATRAGAVAYLRKDAGQGVREMLLAFARYHVMPIEGG
jgi:CheY-like chemotaxis protein